MGAVASELSKQINFIATATREPAGASLLVLKAIPARLGREVTDMLAIPTIGIGAGPQCSGQGLVTHDALGVHPGKKARFVTTRVVPSRWGGGGHGRVMQP